MQKFGSYAIDKEIFIYSGRREEELLKNEISILSTSGEGYDFAFDCKGVSAELSALLVTSFLIFYRGLPLEGLNLLCKGKRYQTYKKLGFAYISIPPQRVNIQNQIIRGCETEYASYGDTKIIFAENYDALDKSILPSIRLLDGKAENKNLAVICGKDGDFSLKYEGKADFPLLKFIGLYLLKIGKLSGRGRIRLDKNTLAYEYENGSLKIGLSPKIMQIY